MKNYIGVDLGLKGAISLVSEETKLIACEPLPVMDVLVGKRARAQYNIQELYAIIMRWTDDFHIEKAGMERLRGMPNQMAQTAFSMGGSAMLFKTIFTITKIPFMEIEPRNWQKKIFGDWGIQYRPVNVTQKERRKALKKASIQAAKQIFPGSSFRVTERCTTDSDGMTDSALIGLYISQI